MAFEFANLLTMWGILGLAGLYVLISVVRGRWLWTSQELRLGKGFPMFLVGGIAVVLILAGGAQVGLLPNLLGNFGLQAAGTEPASAPAAPQQALQVNNQRQAVVVAEPRVLPITTFSVLLLEKYSNKYDQVGNATDGYLRVYSSGTNPGSASANPIVSINVTSGVGSASSPNIKTDTFYRVVFDGGNLHYDVDFGEVQFGSRDFQINTGEYLFDSGRFDGDGIPRVALIDDILNGTAISGDVNGQTTDPAGNEIDADSADDTISYNETQGDGSYFVKPTFALSGANVEAKEWAYCYDWDRTNPPEGDEITELTVQSDSGTDFGLPSDQLAHWSNEDCVALGTHRGGTSGKVKISITVDESNLDNGGDIWNIRVDDLGSYLGRDVRLGKKADADTLTFDSGA